MLEKRPKYLSLFSIKMTIQILSSYKQVIKDYVAKKCKETIL